MPPHDPAYARLIQCQEALRGLPQNIAPMTRALFGLVCALRQGAVELNMLSRLFHVEGGAGVGAHPLRLAICEQLQRQYHQRRLLDVLSAELGGSIVAAAEVLHEDLQAQAYQLLDELADRDDLPAWSDDGSEDPTG